MATLSIGQKAARVLQFLLALRSFAVVHVMAAFGFGPEDLAEGWRLMSQLTHGRLDAVQSGPPVDEGLVTHIDAWENVWFPVADATLATKAPEAHAMIFANLSQTSGPAVIVSVGTFVERVERLDHAVSTGGLGRAGRAARQLLEKRGLTHEKIAEVKALLEKAQTFATDVAPPVPDTSEADAAAEQALWAWYLEWSAIARVAIKDRNVLRRCGFLKPGRPPKSEQPATKTPATPTTTS